MKFLKILEQNAPTGRIPTGTTQPGKIPTGPGLNAEPKALPKVKQNNAQDSSLRQAGGIIRKVGSGVQKLKNTVNKVQDFTKTGNPAFLKDLGQRMINTAIDKDTQKISLFGEKGYESIRVVDVEIINKISLRDDVKVESQSVFSGLLNLKTFVKAIFEADASLNEKVMEFTLGNMTNYGDKGKQWALVPKTPELQSDLSSKGIKIVTFLQVENTHQADDLLGDLEYDNNSGKLQFYDATNQFVPDLETTVSFEWSPELKAYNMGSQVKSHSVSDIENLKKLMEKGIRRFQATEIGALSPRNPREGEAFSFTERSTRARLTGKYHVRANPVSRESFIFVTDCKQDDNTQQPPARVRKPAAKTPALSATKPKVVQPTQPAPVVAKKP